jgi:hypothetical protein
MDFSGEAIDFRDEQCRAPCAVHDRLTMVTRHRRVCVFVILPAVQLQLSIPQDPLCALLCSYPTFPIVFGNMEVHALTVHCKARACKIMQHRIDRYIAVNEDKVRTGGVTLLLVYCVDMACRP